jgi:hypothetical protein
MDKEIMIYLQKYCDFWKKMKNICISIEVDSQRESGRLWV